MKILKIILVLAFIGVSSQIFSQNTKGEAKRVEWDGISTKNAIKHMKVNETTILQTSKHEYEAGGIINEDGSKSTYIRIKKSISEKSASEKTKLELENLQDEVNVSVSPNPLDETTTFQFENIEGKEISLHIYNLTGEVVKEVNNITSENVVFNKDRLASGTYIYKVSSGGNVIKTDKLIINK